MPQTPQGTAHTGVRAHSSLVSCPSRTAFELLWRSQQDDLNALQSLHLLESHVSASEGVGQGWVTAVPPAPEPQTDFPFFQYSFQGGGREDGKCLARREGGLFPAPSLRLRSVRPQPLLQTARRKQPERQWLLLVIGWCKHGCYARSIDTVGPLLIWAFRPCFCNNAATVFGRRRKTQLADFPVIPWASTFIVTCLKGS